MISEQFSDADFEQIVADLGREVKQLKLEVERKKTKQKEVWRKGEELEEKQYVSKPNKTSESHTLNYVQTNQYLCTRNKQTQLLLNELEAEEISLRENIQRYIYRVSDAIDRDEKITSSLNAKVSQYERQFATRPVKDPELVRRSLIANAALVNARFKKLSLLIKGFLQQHFPRPTANDVREAAADYDEDTLEVNRTRGDGPGIAANGLHVKSMSDIIENLVNKHFESRLDTYVTLDETYWTPYVELLIWYGVAVRNPNDAAQLRLRKPNTANGF